MLRTWLQDCHAVINPRATGLTAADSLHEHRGVYIIFDSARKCRAVRLQHAYFQLNTYLHVSFSGSALCTTTMLAVERQHSVRACRRGITALRVAVSYTASADNMAIRSLFDASLDARSASVSAPRSAASRSVFALPLSKRSV